MALGKRRRETQQLWVATTDLPKSPGHVFYRKLNAFLAEAGFDAFLEGLCHESTTLEANAAMKSIVRRDTGEDWREYLKRLMQEAGLIDENDKPSDDDLRRFDQSRKDKSASNEDWVSETDPASRIAKMKDGTTHLAYKAENVVDLKSDLILSAEIYAADQGEARTAVDSLVEAQTHLIGAGSPEMIAEVAADKGYHSAKTLDEIAALNIRTYVAEPKQNHRRRWSDKPAGSQKAVYANRRRMKRDKGRQLQKTRSELVERTFAHMCETGGARRSWLRGIDKVKKRWILCAAARNLGVVLRQLFGIGTARALQGALGLALRVQIACLAMLTRLQAAWSRWELLSLPKFAVSGRAKIYHSA